MSTDGPFTAAANVTLPHYGRLITVGNDYRLTRAFWIASLAITLYDFLLTFGDEMRYVWGGRLTRTRLLFIVNRYWPIANLIFDNIILSLPHPTDGLCFFFYNWFVYSPFLTHVTIGSTLILRIYAMYDCNKRILAVLCTLLVVEIISETIMVGFIAIRLETAHLPPPVTGCVPRHIAHWVWAYWVPMSLFESCLFLLAVFKAVQLAMHRDRHGIGGPPSVLVVLLRDSIIYFGGVLAVILTNFVVWKAGRPSLFSTFPGAAFAVHSILGCRMLLNIQKAVYDEDRHQHHQPVFTTLDTMDFDAALSRTTGSCWATSVALTSALSTSVSETADETPLDTIIGFDVEELPDAEEQVGDDRCRYGTGRGAPGSRPEAVDEVGPRRAVGDAEHELRTRTLSPFSPVGLG